MKTRSLSTWEKLKAYKLHDNIYVLMMLSVSVALSIVVFVLPFTRSVKYLPELALACATSLLASIFCIIADVYVKYKSHKNDEFLEGVHEFGINNLHFDKKQLLMDLLDDCDKEIWISGYRLILTHDIMPSIVAALERGAKIKLLICPPWEYSFKAVYSELARVMDNYYKVFSAIAKTCPNVDEVCEVRFTRKPIFNDTYRVDMHLITGPYMHNRDEEHQRITANDFFTIDLIKQSRLYDLIKNEFLTIWDEADEKLDWSKFDDIAEQHRNEDLREIEKIEMMRSACVKLEEKLIYA